MALSKEMILTLTSLKEVGVRGIGAKRILAIGAVAKDKDIEVATVEDLLSVTKSIYDSSIRELDIHTLMLAKDYASRILEKSNEKGIKLMGYYDNEFPVLLRKTTDEHGKLNPPTMLWYRGDLSVASMPCIAIIGTREPSHEGISGGTYIAEQFAKRGFNIVSGLAMGCDTAAHRGALNVKGRTTAFLANGLDYNSIYPPQNRELAEEIVAKGGLLLSEYEVGRCVERYGLVARDRLQAGLSIATVVIQTGINGGPMHAAEATLKANKPLYVLNFKNPSTNRMEKCLGNEFLVSKKRAKYLSGDDDLDEICKYVKSRRIIKSSLFEDR